MKNSATKNKQLVMSFAALGVVFGDIGTSPLYALRLTFDSGYVNAASSSDIIGAVSLLLWSLISIVSIKYAWILLRADNKGEGGELALSTLADYSVRGKSLKLRTFLMVAGALGAALIFSDGILAPAISVLSAIEGLQELTPAVEPWILPAALLVLSLLFMVQSKGTKSISVFFSPIMLVWFIALIVVGIMSIMHHPEILNALNPWHALNFFFTSGLNGFKILGFVFLAVTGAEVLYADMGHLGKKAIRSAWFFCVFPALAINYMGQGALLLSGESSSNLFYQLFPAHLLIPAVLLATAATVIASQAVITGMFSISRQAMQLGFWPRLRIVHTADDAIGQVYVPFINAALFIGTATLILIFKESDNLANAYGIAVSTTMLLSTSMLAILAYRTWKIPKLATAIIIVFLGTVDFLFFASNSAKVLSGGWIVALIALVVFVFMITWKTGRKKLQISSEDQSLDWNLFIADVGVTKPVRVSGPAVFLTGSTKGVPRSLLHNFKHNKILHSIVVVVSVNIEEVPVVEKAERYELKELGNGFYVVSLRFGFFEQPDVASVLSSIPFLFGKIEPNKTSFFLGRESLVLIPNHKGGMPMWQKKIYRFMSQNAAEASAFFGLPINRVVEVGLQVGL